MGGLPPGYLLVAIAHVALQLGELFDFDDRVRVISPDICSWRRERAKSCAVAYDTKPRAVTSGRSRAVTMPGAAAHTAGIALTAGMAVMIMPMPK